MENILVWIGIILVLGFAIFIMFFRYIVYGVLIIISGFTIFALRKFGLISDKIGNSIIIGIIALLIIILIYHIIKMKS